jgi:hypothetical protein
LAGHLEAVGAGHDHVHQDQLRALGANARDRFVATDGGAHGKAVLDQDVGQVQSFGRRIVDDENLLNGHEGSKSG